MREMRSSMFVAILAGVLGFAASAVGAQSVADATGHWEGEVSVPNNPVAVVFDIAKDTSGALTGTFGQPANNLRGLPLIQVLLEGRTITLTAREDQPFSGTLSDDGTTIDGVLSAQGYDIPLSLTRTGEARIDAPVTSPAVDKRVAGVWRGSVGQAQVVLHIVNKDDGTATAEFENVSEGGLRVPVRTIAVNDTRVTLEIPAIGGSYTGETNVEGTEISGTLHDGQGQVPVTFTRAR